MNIKRTLKVNQTPFPQVPGFTHIPAAPQSSPLPSKAFVFPSEPLQVYQKTDDSDPRTLRIVATAATPQDADLIVRAVNGLPAFEAMERAAEKYLTAFDADDIENRTKGREELRAALALARQSRGE